MVCEPAYPHPVQRLAAGYWAESSRPMAGLLFITPLLIVYELGVLLLGPEAVRNGADLWLRELLRWMGFGQYFLLPLLTVCILLGWHHTSRQPWRISSGILSGMVAECVLLAFGLRVILQLQGTLVQAVAGPAGCVAARAGVVMDVGGTVRPMVGFLGAGVYEELLFRLTLLPSVGWIIHRLGVRRGTSTVAAVCLTSVLFAGAHYLGQHGEAVSLAGFSFWFGFVFRFFAGVFFGVLFVRRGFGIAAGTHAGYDILVGLF